MLQRLPDPASRANSLALQQISDEDLALLRKIVIDRDAGVFRIHSPLELVAVVAFETALNECEGG